MYVTDGGFSYHAGCIKLVVVVVDDVAKYQGSKRILIATSS